MVARDRAEAHGVKDAAAEFVARINEHDVDGLCALMSEDHEFVDSLGNRTRGRETMRNGWARYFSWFPDYRIDVRETHRSGDVLVKFGMARGSFRGTGTPEDSFAVHAAWRAEVRGGAVASWRVYGDNKRAYEVLARHGVMA